MIAQYRGAIVYENKFRNSSVSQFERRQSRLKNPKLFVMLVRLVLTPACQFIGKADATKHPSTSVSETRKTNKKERQS
jgi:hypothetical protein